MENENNAAVHVVTEIGLPELRDVLKAACLSGAPVTLSHLAAGALHYAMTTPPAALPAMAGIMTEEGLQQLKAEALEKAADGANWSMDVGCMFVLAMIERIGAAVSAAARIAELEALVAKRDRAAFIMSQTIHNIMVGNQSAWIEWQNGGAESAMTWIQNGLAGPGLIPDHGGKSAQEWFDENVDERMEPTDRQTEGAEPVEGTPP